MAVTANWRGLASTKYGSDWTLSANTPDGHTWSPDRIQIILLQEIRDQFTQLNALLRCPNFLGMPRDIRNINRKMPVRRPRRSRGKG